MDNKNKITRQSKHLKLQSTKHNQKYCKLQTNHLLRDLMSSDNCVAKTINSKQVLEYVIAIVGLILKCKFLNFKMQIKNVIQEIERQFVVIRFFYILECYKVI